MSKVWNVGALKRCEDGDEMILADYPDEHGKGAHSLDDNDFTTFQVDEKISDIRVRLSDGRIVRMSGAGTPVDESRNKQVVVVGLEQMDDSR